MAFLSPEKSKSIWTYNILIISTQTRQSPKVQTFPVFFGVGGYKQFFIMAKRTIIADITIEYRFRITFDDESPDYKDSLESYQCVIENKGDEESMLKHAIFNVACLNTKEVEGVGFIAVDGVTQGEGNMPYSGITFETVYEEETDINLTEYKTCRICGCTGDRACVTNEGPCSWVEIDLCNNPDCLEKSKIK